MGVNIQLPEGEMRVAYCGTLDKLIAAGDGDAALVYLYILRYGGAADEKAAARALHLPADRCERAVFTLNGLTAPAAPQAERPAAAPAYNADELRRARTEDLQFSAVCESAEQMLGRTLNEGQLRALLAAYDHLGLSAGAIIELLAYLKKEKGAVRVSDIRRESSRWADIGVLSAEDAQIYVRRLDGEKPFCEAVYRAMQADPDKPSPKEQRLCSYALSRGFPPEAVELAARRTERKKGRRSLDYIGAILRRWDEAGVHTVSEITALEPESRTGRQAVGQTPAQPTDAATLSAWEQEWLEQTREVQRRRREAT